MWFLQSACLWGEFCSLIFFLDISHRIGLFSTPSLLSCLYLALDQTCVPFEASTCFLQFSLDTLCPSCHTFSPALCSQCHLGFCSCLDLHLQELKRKLIRVPWWHSGLMIGVVTAVAQVPGPGTYHMLWGWPETKMKQTKQNPQKTKPVSQHSLKNVRIKDPKKLKSFHGGKEKSLWRENYHPKIYRTEWQKKKWTYTFNVQRNTIF